jgi:hypothetical protein
MTTMSEIERAKAIEKFMWPYGRALMLIMGVTTIVRPKGAKVH